MSSIIKLSICDKLTSHVDAILNNMTLIQSDIIKEINNFEDEISDYQFDPATDIDKVCEELSNRIDEIVPDLPDFDEILDIINSCDYLASSAVLSEPFAILKGISTPVKDNSYEKISDLTNNLPEFNAAKSFRSVMDKIKSGNLDSNIPEVNKALNCISSICGTDITSRLNTLVNIANNCFVTIDGTINLQSILEGQGIPPEVILNIIKADQSFTSISSLIDSRLIEAKSRLIRVNI